MKKKLKLKKKHILIIVVLVIVFAVSMVYNNASQLYDDGIDIVCLDAGHGGSDPGAVSSDGNRYEKDDDLALTLKVKEQLEAKGITVVLTREDDSEVSLNERCRIGNRKHCDLFISIHRNSAGKNATGVEAWVSTAASAKESKVAKAVLENICEVTGQKNRGAKHGYQESAVGNYYINSKTKMPSFLLEVGFISNESDNEIFDKKLDETAVAIADAVVDSFFN